MKCAAALLLAVGLLWPGPAAALAEDRSTDKAVERCREAFPEVVEHPGRPGGLFIEQTSYGTLLCLYGSLEKVSPTDLASAFSNRIFDVAVARSTGGPVNIWLSAAEQLVDNVAIGIVDEACFSSCANYFAVLPKNLYASENSLVIWHGGPADGDIEMFDIRDMTITDLIEYQELSGRTKALYERLRVSIDLLNQTGVAPTDEKLAELAMPQLRDNIVGYAVSPARLVECFNLKAAATMWHAGNDGDVVALAHRRSSAFSVLEWPYSAEQQLSLACHSD